MHQKRGQAVVSTTINIGPGEQTGMAKIPDLNNNLGGVIIREELRLSTMRYHPFRQSSGHTSPGFGHVSAASARDFENFRCYVWSQLVIQLKQRVVQASRGPTQTVRTRTRRGCQGRNQTS